MAMLMFLELGGGGGGQFLLKYYTGKYFLGNIILKPKCYPDILLKTFAIERKTTGTIN